MTEILTVVPSNKTRDEQNAEVPQWLKDLGLTKADLGEADLVLPDGQVLEAAPYERVHALDSYFADFINQEPYFSALLMQMSKFYTKSIDTMCVTWDGDGYTLGVNPKFVWGLHDRGDCGPEILSVIMHELCHVHEGHLTERAGDLTDTREQDILGAACDMAVNTVLVHEYNKVLPYSPWLPGARPGEPFAPANGTTKFPLGDKERAVFDAMPLTPLDQAVINAPKLLSLEAYADLLRPVWIDRPPRAGTDDHTKWVKVKKADAGYAKEKLREIMRRAANTAEGKGWGSVPEHMRARIRRFVNGEVDWREEFRQWVGINNTGHDRFSTRRKNNRKYPLMHPGTRVGRGIRAIVCRDESFSVSDKMLADVSKELNGIGEIATITVLPFCCGPCVESDCRHYEAGDEVDINRTKGGGTDFDSPTAFVNSEANRGRFDVMIMLTDGEANKPQSSAVPRLWVLPSGKNLLFETDEKVIVLTEDGK